MNIPIKEAAALTGASLEGDDTLVIKGISKIQEAAQGDLTFLYLPAYYKYFASTKASAIIVKPDFKRTRSDITYLVTESPEKALSRIIVRYFPVDIDFEGIDTTASVHPSAAVGKNVALGKNVVIEKGAVIGDNTKIYHNTVIGSNVVIGSGTLIYQNVSVREDCVIGSGVIIHANSVVGSDGFGYQPDEKGRYTKIPQIGNVVLEDDVELGSNVSIDRAAFGSTVLKRGVKIDNLVQIAHNCVIGEDTVISAQSGISGSVELGSHCVIGGQVGFVGHITISDNVMIGAKSGISRAIEKPGQYFGIPARELRTTLKLEALYRRLPDYVSKISELEKKIEMLEERALLK